MLKTFGARSSQAAAPYLWNRLPREIRLIKNLQVDKLKNAIKTFYLMKLLVIINLDHICSLGLLNFSVNFS